MAQQQVLVEEQHPIPQQISAFQFHLVGDMTLKQFIQLAAGAIVALLFYASPLHPAIKWPFIFFSFGFGAALAFLPLEDRPLAKWIYIFFKAIYSPTLFVWKKLVAPTSYFQPETAKAPVAKAPEAQALATKQAIPEEAKLEKKEETFLSKVSGLSEGTASVEPLVAKAIPAYQQPIQQTPPKTIKGIEIPQTSPVQVEPSLKQDQDTARVVPVSTDIGVGTYISPRTAQSDQKGTLEAQFSPEASPPSPPMRPNTIVGQVMDENGKILEGAILEILDEDGRPARALKTNKLGHFLIVTPLINGKYKVIIEKEGFEFDTVSFDAKGEMIPPIAIKAKKGLVN